jgi:serine protease inhibitor
MNDMNSRLQNRDMNDISIFNNNRSKMKHSNRFEIERDEFMRNSNSDEDEYNSQLSQRQFSDNIRHNFERGMPSRPNVEINKNSNIDNNDFVVNMDQLKQKRPTRDISSFDPNSNLADINHDTKLSDSVSHINVCTNGINDFGLFFYDNLLNIMNTNFIISPFLIYSTFGSLFLGSDGNTEVELKNYFNMPRVDVLSAGLTELYQKYLNQTILHGEIKFGNCIIFTDELDYNPQFCNNINLFTKIRKVNQNNSIKESDDINNIISSITKNNKKSISQQNIENNCITLLNYASITPTWKSKFSKISTINGVQFMHAYNERFGYFEQPNLQVLELESTGNICFGIIYGDIELNVKNYKFIISNLRMHTLNEVMIPMLKIQTKLRYTNVLKETDLKTIFEDLDVPNLFPSSCNISDCIQNMEFILTNKSENISSKNTGIVTSKKFIVSQAFRFYIRLKSNNCILFLGTY